METRTSSPAKIICDNKFETLDICGLYPYGEGVDGIKVAQKIVQRYI